MDESGFNEVILESSICTSSSINGVMKGKHYNRAIRVHLAVCEALERLLLERFLALKVAVKKLPSNLHGNPSKKFWDLSLEDASFIHLFDA